MLRHNIVSILAIVLAVYAHSARGDPNYEKMQIIERSMNQSVDPCEDFYNYACSNWQKHYATDNFSEILRLMDYKFNEKLQHLLQLEARHEHPSREGGQSALDKMLIFYKSCQDRGIPDMIKYFNVVKPGNGLEWPILQTIRSGSNITPQWSEGRFDVFQLLGELMSYGFDNVIVKQGLYRARNGTLKIYLSMPEASKDDEEPLTLEETVGLLYFLGVPKESAVVYGREIMQMEEFWLDAYQRYEESENEQLFTYYEIKYTYPSLAKLLDAMIPHQMRDDDTVDITNIDYYHFLLGHSWQRGDSQNLVNYLMYKFLSFAGDNSETDCLSDVRQKMDMAVNYMFAYHEYLPRSQQVNAEISGMTEKIFRSFLEIIDENHLRLSADQMHRLKEKMSEITVNLGNLPESIDVDKLNEYYRDVSDLDENSYFENHLKIMKHSSSLLVQDYHRLHHSLEYFDCTGYDVDVNMMVIPFEFLEAPMYDSGYDPLFKWSLLGFAVSHEFSHAIDNVGLERDRFGVVTSDFDDIVENPRFNREVECFKDQEYTENVEERLANNVGLRVAYHAYMQENRMQLQPTFTRESWKKLFFLNLAQFYCGNDGDDAPILNQMMENFDEFAQAYSCPVGSNMNPQHKCRFY